MGEGDDYKTRMTLLEKLRDKHDDAAWSDFAYYYRGYIYNIARRMGLSHADSEDVVQDVLLKSWNKLPEFRYDPGKGRFRGWLCRVTGSAVKNRFRDSVNRSIELDGNPEAEAALTIPPDIERIAEEEWREYLPKLAWKNVSERFGGNIREVHRMLMERKTPAEIAVVLGITESSVYVYRKRIQDALRPEIKRLERELG